MDGGAAERIHEFDGFVVDVVRRAVSRDGEAVQLTSKALDTLLFLIANRGVTVTKAQIMDAVWPDTAVEENNLTQQISALRKAFGEQPNDHRFIVTVPGTGYAFIAPMGRPVDKIAPRSHVRDLFAEHGGLGYVVALLMIVVAVLPVGWQLARTDLHNAPATIAVLSFRSVDGVDDQLAAGLPYTLTAKLGDLREVLSVRPATDMATSKDVLAAGRELKVDAVLNGAIQHRGDKIRVTVQMVEVSGGRVVWGENIDADGSEDFAAQDAVATKVIAGLRDFYARD